MSSTQPAAAFGRVLRVLLGLALLVYVAPVYFRLPLDVVVKSLLLVLGLVGVCSVLLVASTRHVTGFGPWVWTILGTAILVGLYAGGSFPLPIVGNGKGQLATFTFLGISLAIAGVRGLPGCEIMAIPSIFVRGKTNLPCIIFTPLDKLEHKLRTKHRD